jgi:hypothetical protein
MIQISSTFSAPPLLSPRTADYVSALIREGDDFDYCEWLQRVRGEEARTKCTPSKLVDPEMDNQAGTSAYHSTWPNSLLLTRAARFPKALRQSHRASSKTSEIRIRLRLEKIRDAWDVFQARRARDAVYGYLETVFAIVEHYKVRRRTPRLRRHAFEFANLPLNNSSDIFTVVIRCTCADNADSKTISKWARALRYVARCKEPGTRVRAFMKEVGGVNACADRYAKYLGRSR